MKRVACLVVFIGLISFSCSNKADLTDDAIPKTLLIALYEEEGPQSTASRLDFIKEHLEAKLQLPVEFVKTTDYTSVIEALRAKKVHMATMSPFSYAIAAEKVKLEVLVTTGVNGTAGDYLSIIITGKNSGLKSMDDVKARANELTFCFTDPASASGHLIPRAYLNTIGIIPESNFKQTLFASSHTASMLTVKEGKVDVGCSLVGGLNLLIRRGSIKPDDIVVLWKSDPIVNGPFVMRDDINKAFSEKVRQAFLTFKEDNPSLFDKYLIAIYGNTKNDSIKFVKAHDSLYNGIRKIMKGLPNVDN